MKPSKLADLWARHRLSKTLDGARFKLHDHVWMAECRCEACLEHNELGSFAHGYVTAIATFGTELVYTLNLVDSPLGNAMGQAYERELFPVPYVRSWMLV